MLDRLRLAECNMQGDQGGAIRIGSPMVLQIRQFREQKGSGDDDERIGIIEIILLQCASGLQSIDRKYGADQRRSL